MNDKSGEPAHVNVLLLDKINRHHDVIRQLIKIQREEIETKIPTFFVQTS